VVVVDESDGRGASWAAAGLLAPVTEAHFGEEELLKLNLRSAESYPAFVEALQEDGGIDPGFRRCGTLVVARDRDDAEVLDELSSYQQRLGLEVIRLHSKECRELEPGLTPSIRGGIFVDGDHQIDNRALLNGLRNACVEKGVGLLHDQIESITKVGEPFVCTTVSGDQMSAGVVVIAAGHGSTSIEGIAEVAPPVRPVKGQLLHLSGPDVLATHNVRGLDVYIVPRSDGRVVVGATMEELGTDDIPSAEAVYTLLRDAFEILPSVLDLRFVEIAVGHRPATPDNAPAIGESGIDGLLFATGHFRNGVLLAPVTAEAIAQQIETGSVPEWMLPFSPLRFLPVQEAV
jgi:glycine oxidase